MSDQLPIFGLGCQGAGQESGTDREASWKVDGGGLEQAGKRQGRLQQSHNLLKAVSDDGMERPDAKDERVEQDDGRQPPALLHADPLDPLCRGDWTVDVEGQGPPGSDLLFQPPGVVGDLGRRLRIPCGRAEVAYCCHVDA
jgi:hypothetical protein